MIHNFFHYISHHIWILRLLGTMTGFIFGGLVVIFRVSLLRTARKIINRILPFTTPSWKIVMSVYRPNGGRPRYFSLHTLAALTGRNDLLQLAKEMKRSHEVNASFCGGVKSPVFYLRNISHHNEPSTWKRIPDFLKQYPYPAVKGFKHGEGKWSGGGYGKGTYTPPDNAMSDPFIEDDHGYANKIIRTLRAKGRKPGIPEYKIDKSQPIW